MGVIVSVSVSMLFDQTKTLLKRQADLGVISKMTLTSFLYL
jgi:hypothetical protein